MEAKKCTKCGQIKPLDEFPPDKKHSDGRASGCRVCGRAACKRWADGHKDSIRARVIKNKEHIAARNRVRWLNNKEKLYQQHRAWVKANPIKMKEYGEAWRQRNIEHARDLARKAAARRTKTPEGRLRNVVSNGLRQTLAKGSKGRQHWEFLVGYTVHQLKHHLEKQFKPGMSWDNYGEWEIDHKIPLSAFNFKTPDDIDFKRAWALKNLQPLWMPENRSKKDHMDKPFQPSLAISA